jgi:hypothetical protein
MLDTMMHVEKMSVLPDRAEINERVPGLNCQEIIYVRNAVSGPRRGRGCTECSRTHPYDSRHTIRVGRQTGFSSGM